MEDRPQAKTTLHLAGGPFVMEPLVIGSDHCWFTNRMGVIPICRIRYCSERGVFVGFPRQVALVLADAAHGVTVTASVTPISSSLIHHATLGCCIPRSSTTMTSEDA